MPESKVRKSKQAAYTPEQAKSAKNLPPSPAWYGAVILVLFAIAIVILIGYSLGPIPGLGSLGSWNYLIAMVAFIAAVGMLTRWR